MLTTMITTWTRATGWRRRALLGSSPAAARPLVILCSRIGPGHYKLGPWFDGRPGITAYTYGLRHAFDADHIAAIDNTTRKLRGDGKRPKSVGFWFAIGPLHDGAGLSALVAAGAHVVGTLTTTTALRASTLGIISTGVVGSFLYLIAIFNLAALTGIMRVFRAMRRATSTRPSSKTTCNPRFMNRILAG